MPSVIQLPNVCSDISIQCGHDVLFVLLVYCFYCSISQCSYCLAITVYGVLVYGYELIE